MTDIAKEVEKIAEDLGIDRKRSIGEVAKELEVKTHVIRFWEENFSQIKPEIGAGGRRYYYNEQIKVLKRIKKFLYEEGYTIAGLQKLLKKRKTDEYKEEDLDVINQAKKTHHEEIEEKTEPTKKEVKKIEMEDFISEKTNTTIGKHLDPSSRMLDFADIKISKIHPEVQKEINEKIKNIKENLKVLKVTASKNF